MNDEYKAEIFGSFKPDPQLETAVGYWLEYYDACEIFDRSVCSGTRNGVAMPLTSWESGEINRNAGQLHKRLLHKMREAGIPETLSQQAQEIAIREHERRLKQDPSR